MLITINSNCAYLFGQKTSWRTSVSVINETYEHVQLINFEHVQYISGPVSRVTFLKSNCVSRCVCTGRTILPNFIVIRFEVMAP